MIGRALVPYLVGGAVIAAVAVGGWLYWKGGADTSRKIEVENAKDYKDATQADRAEQGRLPTDDDARREWLRNYPQ